MPGRVVALAVAGAAVLLAADSRTELSDVGTLAAVAVGVACVALAMARAVALFAATKKTVRFPDDPPPGALPVETFACLTPGGPRADDGVSSADAIAAMTAASVRGRGQASSRAPAGCAPSLWSDPPTDTPAGLTFDGLFLRALYAEPLPPLASEQADGQGPPGVTDAQLRAFLEAAAGREALWPSIGTYVPLQVPCVLVRGSPRRLGDSRSLVHVEFLAMRDGDSLALHYEAHIATAPLALVWFRRVGQVVSADVSCRALRQRLK